MNKNMLKEDKFSDVRRLSNVWVGQKFCLGVFITSYGKHDRACWPAHYK